ncbi:hypothetical protein HK101_002879 [Irineochytrium annulatum]|nr:hypothetical protein HK101_002879 [Irineochytrium annulatum]
MHRLFPEYSKPIHKRMTMRLVAIAESKDSEWASRPYEERRAALARAKQGSRDKMVASYGSHVLRESEEHLPVGKTSVDVGQEALNKRSNGPKPRDAAILGFTFPNDNMYLLWLSNEASKLAPGSASKSFEKRIAIERLKAFAKATPSFPGRTAFLVGIETDSQPTKALQAILNKLIARAGATPLPGNPRIGPRHQYMSLEAAASNGTGRMVTTGDYTWDLFLQVS